MELNNYILVVMLFCHIATTQ